MKEYCVYIQTNHKQIIGAMVAQYALRRYSRHNDAFDVRIMDTRDYPFFAAREGQLYRRGGVKRPWLNDDLQSFTPTRFMPPELMGHKGRALVIDPDIFAMADVWELLSRDMSRKSILCRRMSGPLGILDRCLASSVMLLDCAKLAHWNVEEAFNELFESTRDYQSWICLRLEDRDSIGALEVEWNDFDRLTPATKMLHLTRRLTQPWKTGLPIDWRPADNFTLFPPVGWLMRARRRFFGEYGLLGSYRRHPDPNQEHFFFGLLKECLAKGVVSEDLVREQMRLNHVRHDALEVLKHTPDLPPAPHHPLSQVAARAA